MFPLLPGFCEAISQSPESKFAQSIPKLPVSVDANPTVERSIYLLLDRGQQNGIR
jgi:hypothetical protein